MEKKTAYLIVGHNVDLKKYPFVKDSYLIGVDRGAFLCLKASLRIDLAYGDFDSCTIEEMKALNESGVLIKKVDPVKDATDTEGALSFAAAYKNVVILGGIQGKRPEHFLTNLNLMKKKDGLSMVDDSTCIFKLSAKGEDQILIKGAYKFFSFYSEGESVITLKGFKYSLLNYLLTSKDSLCVSNQILAEEGKVRIDGEDVIVVESKEDQP